MRKWKVTVELDTDIHADTADEAKAIADEILQKILLPGSVDDWDADVQVQEFDERADHAYDLAGDR